MLLLCAAFSSCSSDDDGDYKTPENNDGRKQRQLTISEVPITRATLTDNSSTLGARWKAGDVATLVNVSAIPTEMLFGYFTATSDEEASSFTGSIDCDSLDMVALIYPQVTPAVGNGQFTISLSGQKGTLEDLAERYHYVYGVGQVTSVTETTANASISTTQPLLAVAKFTFKDATDDAIPVKTLIINYGDAEVGYPQSGTVTPSTNVANVVATPETQNEWDGHPLIVNLDTETANGVYVTLFPLSTKDYFHFTVTGSGGTYTGTASAKLQAGKYYPVNLKLTKNN